MAIGILIMAVTAAAALAGLTGFGFNLLSVPLLVLVIEPHAAVVLSLMLGILTSGIMLTSSRLRSQVRWRSVSMLLIAAAAGLPVGSVLFAKIRPLDLQLVVSGLSLAYVVITVARVNPASVRSRAFGPFAGFASGLLSASTGFSGPPAIAYAYSQRWPSAQLRATLTSYILAITVLTVSLLALEGQLTFGLLQMSLALSPGVVIGILAGQMIFRRLPSQHFQTLVLILLAVMGVANLAAALH